MTIAAKKKIPDFLLCVENREFRKYLFNSAHSFSECIEFLKIENIPRAIANNPNTTLVLQSDEKERIIFDIGKKLKGVFF